MGVHATTVGSTAIVNTAPANGVDAILVTTPAIGLPYDNAQVLLFWYLVISTGVGATTFNVRLRRGSLVSSPLININAAVPVAASAVVVLSGCYADLPGIVAGQQYSISGIVSGGAAAVNITDVSLIALCL